ncbi:MAG: chemotaxis protein CheD [Thermoanaerobaculales bacterium]|nr:chemotaxis protein CheD [Thermoanaerobaculales bacterium]
MRIFWDREHATERVVIEPGEFHTASDDRVICTVLGSCVSVCLKDSTGPLAGMNHFMLPDAVSKDALFSSESGRYGINAMELLITELQQRGARRQDLVAKVFGGGHMLDIDGSASRIPTSNLTFAISYLKEEGIPILSKDVGGRWARRIAFHTRTNEVAVSRFVRKAVDVAHLENNYRRRIRRINGSNGFVLFDRRALP